MLAGQQCIVICSGSESQGGQANFKSLRRFSISDVGMLSLARDVCQIVEKLLSAFNPAECHQKITASCSLVCSFMASEGKAVFLFYQVSQANLGLNCL